MSRRCIFCKIASEDPHDQILRGYTDAVVFEPIGPVVPGHLLVVPREHVRDAREDPSITADVMAVAAIEAYKAGPCNIITSCGAEATQTVFHLHVHIVPRVAGDGLALPWTEQVHA